MSRHDPQNTGFVRLPQVRASEPRAWIFKGSGRVWGYKPGMNVWTSPAVGEVDGRAVVVVGSYDKNIYCLEAASGALLWKYTTGDGVYATPALWTSNDEAWVFASSSDRLVYALDSRIGRRRWIHSLESFRPTLGGARLSSPCVGRAGEHDALFVGHWIWDRSLTRNQQEGGVTALGAHSGKSLWHRLLGDNEITSPVYLELAGRRLLLVGSANGNLYTLDADSGDTLWSRTELDAIRSPPAVAVGPTGPQVIMASKFGLVRCLRAEDGSEVWRYKTGDWVTGSPVVANIAGRQMVIVGSYDRSLYAIDFLSGQLVWRYFARGGVHASAALAPRGARPLVIASAWDHHLHGIDARDGTGLWTIYTGRPLWDAVGLEHSTWSSPAIAKLGEAWVAYVGSYDGTFYALPLADLTTLAAKRQRSNMGFWLSFPIALACVSVLAFLLTFRHRARRRARGAR